MAKRPERKTAELYSGPAATAAAGPEVDRLFGLSGPLPQLVEIDLDWIDPRPGQPRTVFDDAALQSLAQSLREHGLKQPVLVRQEVNGRYTLVAGERRLRAQRLNGVRTIIAIVVTDQDPDVTALIENMQRVDLDAVDQATAVDRLIETHGYTQEQIAPFLGVSSHSQVSRLLNLLRLPAALLVDYRRHSQTVSRATLLEIAEVDGPELQFELWRAAKAGLGSKQIRARKKAAAEAAPAEARVLRTIGQVMISMTKQVETLTQHRDALAKEHLEHLRGLRGAIDRLLGTP
jgi:ParB family chromosome partitioning protein